MQRALNAKGETCLAKLAWFVEQSSGGEKRKKRSLSNGTHFSIPSLALSLMTKSIGYNGHCLRNLEQLSWKEFNSLSLFRQSIQKFHNK